MNRRESLPLILTLLSSPLIYPYSRGHFTDDQNPSPEETLAKLIDKYLPPAEANSHLNELGLLVEKSVLNESQWLAPLSLLELGKGVCDEFALAHYVITDLDTVFSKHIIAYIDSEHKKLAHVVMVYQNLDGYWEYTSNLDMGPGEHESMERAIIDVAYRTGYEPRGFFYAWEVFPDRLPTDWKTKRGDISLELGFYKKTIDVSSHL